MWLINHIPQRLLSLGHLFMTSTMVIQRGSAAQQSIIYVPHVSWHQYFKYFYTSLLKNAQHDPKWEYTLARCQYQGQSGNTHHGIGHHRSSKSAGGTPQSKPFHCPMTPSRGTDSLHVSHITFKWWRMTSTIIVLCVYVGGWALSSQLGCTIVMNAAVTSCCDGV